MDAANGVDAGRQDRTNLVITRGDGESVEIGDVTITILRTGPRPRLRISAPRDVKILRSELLQRAGSIS